MTVKRREPIVKTIAEVPIVDNSVEEIIAEVPPEEPKMFASRWIQKYGSRYPKDALGAFKYKVDRHALGVHTPSEWHGLFEGTIPFPSKVGQ